MKRFYHAGQQDTVQLSLFSDEDYAGSNQSPFSILEFVAPNHDVVASKVCKDCGNRKPIELFAKQSRRKDGCRPYCKDCFNKRNRAYVAKNQERIQQYRRNHYHTHKDYYRQYHKEHRRTHRERYRQRARAQYYAHREQKLEWGRSYRETHREQMRQLRQSYHETHLEYERQRCKEWRKSNPLKNAELSRRYTATKRSTSVDGVNYRFILERDGMHCYICEKDILPHHTMHFDHVVPLSRGGTHTEENVRPTHAQCNLRKHDKLLSEMDAFDRRGVTE